MASLYKYGIISRLPSLLLTREIRDHGLKSTPHFHLSKVFCVLSFYLQVNIKEARFLFELLEILQRNKSCESVSLTTISEDSPMRHI